MIDNKTLSYIHCGAKYVKPDYRMMAKRGNIPTLIKEMPIDERPKWIIRMPVRRREQIRRWTHIAYPNSYQMRYVLRLRARMFHDSEFEKKVVKEFKRLNGMEAHETT